MSLKDKPLVWLHGQVKSPPLSSRARVEADYLIRLLQSGGSLSMSHSRPMPIIGKNCHELRLTDESRTWRIFYRIDNDAIVIADVFEKKSKKTPRAVIENCKARLRMYNNASR